MNRRKRVYEFLRLVMLITLAIVPVANARASLMFIDLTVLVSSGPLAGNEYRGVVTYEGSLVEPPVLNSGIEVTTIDEDQNLQVRFDFAGSHFTDSSGTNLLGPLVQLANGSINGPMFGGFFWIVVQVPFPFDLAVQFSGDVFNYSALGGGGSGTVTTTEPRAVPEPLPWTLLPLAGFAWALSHVRVARRTLRRNVQKGHREQ